MKENARSFVFVKNHLSRIKTWISRISLLDESRNVNSSMLLIHLGNGMNEGGTMVQDNSWFVKHNGGMNRRLVKIQQKSNLKQY